MSTVVLSVRVRRELKEEVERLGIDVRKVVESSLEKAVMEAKRKRVEVLFRQLGGELADIGEEEWVRLVRESRRGRYGV
ncbi:DUF4145 domain-containing protein [Candidatus Bathyarchaeota archaeon]|nr:DUF4145 domain-containing protein [Candidatus Bathyarchaeota archaeon]